MAGLDDTHRVGEIFLRRALPRDVAALAELARETYAAAFGHSMTEEDLSAHLERHLDVGGVARWLERDVVQLAVEAGDHRLVGYVQYGAAEPEVGGPASSRADPGEPSRIMALRRLYVSPALQNRGIGSRLLAAAVRGATMMEATDIVLDVWEHNEGALRFYRRYDFEIVGRRRFTVASGAEMSDDLVMWRPAPDEP